MRSKTNQKKYKNLRGVAVLFLSLLFWSCKKYQPIENQDSRPNILLIVADDMGYADLGCFGSDIQTPHIDALAKEGLRFTNFYSAPSCAPTRASLLTGADNHMAGVGSQFHRKEDEWGYEGFLSDRVVTIPQVLTEENYQTYMVGKWHLGGELDQLPDQKGFQKSFVMHQGAGNHYNSLGFEGKNLPSTYSLNGRPATWPENAYSTDLYTNYLIDFIVKGKTGKKPFFAFAAYTSPHWPLQVDRSYWEKYEVLYKEGYEALRLRRLQTLKAQGIIANDHPLPPAYPNIVPWDSLTSEQQKIETRKMALYAGMLENLDANVGRLISTLKENGMYNNTVIVFMSDNGAAYRDFYNAGPFTEFLQATYDNSYENMGSASSFVSYGSQWAEAGSAPFRYLKRFTFEGGIRVPLIIRAPSLVNKGALVHGFTTVTDLAPSFYELAQTHYPDTYKGKAVYPLQGASLLPLVRGTATEVHSEQEIWTMEHHHHALVRKGPWKLVNPGMMWDESKFELYHIMDDPAEHNNIRREYPDVYTELLEAWHTFKNQHRIQRYN